jgi:hypothetical protein
MKDNNIYNPTNTAEQWTYGMLGVTGLLSVILAVVSLSHFVQGENQAIAEWSGKAPRTQMTALRYVKSGRWRADARTLGAMALYLIEREPDQEFARVNANLKANVPTVRAALPVREITVIPKV